MSLGNIDEFIRNYRKNLNSPKYFFKETWFGWVLMINDPQPTESPGIFQDKWRKATKDETQKFLMAWHEMQEKAVKYDDFKDKNPEYFL